VTNLKRATRDKTPPEQRIQFVIFQLGPSYFGVPIVQVVRILRMMDITRVPRAPGFLEGVINVEGDIVPVVSLKKRFELEYEETDPRQARILIVEVKDQIVGMIVDAVTGITWVPVSAIEPPPSMVADISGVYLTGIARHEGRLLIMLDLSRVLTTEEVSQLETISLD